MPCSDITEVFEAQLDSNDRLLSYGLRKRTCGAEIGRVDLLAGLFSGLTIDALLALEGDDVRAHVGTMADDEEFLFMKHLVATQAALRVYSGASRGSPKDPCVVESLEAHPQGVRLVALVAIDALTDEIRACGNCGSCGSAKKARSGL